MTAPPVIAVVPFGARAKDPRAGAWARQLARRLVDRFADDASLELRPVFLVAMPEEATEAGYLVFGSSPEADLAGQYASSLGATHALTAIYREEGATRVLDATLVEASTRRAVGQVSLPIPPGALHRLEPELAAWLVRALGTTPSSDVTAPAAGNETAYTALLEGMDEEVNATLLRPSDAHRADHAVHSALDAYVRSARADPESSAPEARILVLAAESLERGNATHDAHALEELITIRPRSWRAHYILGQLRAEAGDANSAIVAFEHAHSLHPLPDVDIVRLAELYANAGAIAPARAHLRRIARTSAAYGSAQELAAIIAFQRGEIDAGREAFDRAIAAGTKSWELYGSYGAALHAKGDLADAAARYREALAAGAPSIVRLNLARVMLATDQRETALAELDTLLASERVGEAAGHAHRLRFGLRAPALEQELEQAGQAALTGDASTLENAKAVFERALATEPDLWEAHFGLGIVARQRGDGARAQEEFEKVLSLWPDQPDALHELGVALLMRDDINPAVRALDRAASLRPDDAAYMADAGFAHLRAGNLESARRHLERASGIDANDPITKSYIGELLRVESEVGKRPQ